MLPCNVIVQQLDEKTMEIAVVDPVASMMAVENEAIVDIAVEIREKLNRVIDAL